MDMEIRVVELLELLGGQFHLFSFIDFSWIFAAPSGKGKQKRKTKLESVDEP